MKRFTIVFLISVLFLGIGIQSANAQSPYARARLLVWQDTLFGLIDGTGKTVLPCEFEDITIYSGKVYQHDYIIAKRDGRWNVTTWEGDMMKIFFYDVEPLPIPNCREDLFLIPYKDKLRGVVDLRGFTVIPFRHRDLALNDYYHPCYNRTDIHPRLTYTSYSGLKGCLNEYGREVIPPIYKRINFADRMITVEDTNGCWGLMDYDGRWLREPDTLYSLDNYRVYYDHSCRESYMPIIERKTNLQGLVNHSGEIVLPIRYREIHPMYPNLMSMKDTSGLYCLADAQFRTLTPHRYKELFNLGEVYSNGWIVGILPDGSAEILDTLGCVVQTDPPLHFDEDNIRYEFPLVEVADKWQIVSPKGKLLPQRYYDASQYWSETLFSVAVDSLHWGIVNRKGRVIVPLRYVAADASGDDIIFARRASGKVDVFNGKGRKLLTCWGAQEDGDMLVVANSEGKWALADKKNGRVLSLYYKEIEPIYFSDTTGFSYFWEVFDDNKRMGYLDGRGREIFPCSLDASYIWELSGAPIYKFLSHDCRCGKLIYYYNMKKDAN